jgi:hypothetical protein
MYARVNVVLGFRTSSAGKAGGTEHVGSAGDLTLSMAFVTL